MKRLWLSVVLGLGALPAQAQDVPLDAGLIDQCLVSGEGAACIGVAIEPCMTALGGFSTPAHVGCAAAELAWWDEFLNDTYSDAMARAQTIDTQSVQDQNRPSDVAALRRMQRAWIPFRDAACDYEALQWWGGTGASGAQVECVLRMTGAQALVLQSYVRDR